MSLVYVAILTIAVGFEHGYKTPVGSTPSTTGIFVFSDTGQ